IIQIDVSAEEFHQNIPTTLPLLGDVGETAQVLRKSLKGWKFDSNSKWMKTLHEKAEKNKETVEKMINDESTPLNYYAAYKALPVVVVVVNNGGIYRGLTPEDFKSVDGDPTLQYPVLSLTPECRYDEMAKAFGGRGVLCRTVDEVRKALPEAYECVEKEQRPTLINLIIANDS
uniref:Thiamine pyrophosphate enzyme TPP-binding domain-containing protein n=1 Tax=Panagrolaimus sp. ES5 TaxID=591445 RepID=A0AC34GEY2_9BILA